MMTIFWMMAMWLAVSVAFAAGWGMRAALVRNNEPEGPTVEEINLEAIALMGEQPDNNETKEAR